jgi:hypothetical protein
MKIDFLVRLTLLIVLVLPQAGCGEYVRNIVLTYDVQSSEPVRLKFALCKQDIEVADAERRTDRKIVVECKGWALLHTEVGVGGRDYVIEKVFELEGARRLHYDIKISPTVIEETYSDSAYCPNRDELCGHHFWTGFYSRIDGTYITDPENPLLDDRQRTIRREIVQEKEALDKKGQR